MITITVSYTCGLCEATNAEVSIAARASDEDLLEWMAKLTAIVSDDHRRRSPGCFARKLKELTIPISNAEWVGGPPIQ